MFQQFARKLTYSLLLLFFVILLLPCKAEFESVPRTAKVPIKPQAKSSPFIHQPGLKVNGPLLMYRGKSVRLRGVAVGDPILTRQDRPVSDYRYIAAEWKANVVRISIHPTVWRHEKREKVLRILDRDIRAALDAGMFVILDWHTIGWPDGYFENPALESDDRSIPLDLYDSTFSLATDFWKEMAKRYGRDGRIIFEIWNEPVSKNDYSHRYNEETWLQLKPYWESLVSVIRTDSENVILVSGNVWAYNMRGIKKSPMDDENVAYSWHIFAGNDNNVSRQWALALDGLFQLFPVVVTEWGFEEGTPEHYRGSCETFGDVFAEDFLEGRHLHSTAWCWNPECGPRMLKDDWKTRTTFGSFVLQYLLKNNKNAVRPAK